jgi:hypothetical protein
MCIFSHYRKQIYQTSYNAFDANVDRRGPRVLLAPPPADAHDAHRAIRPPIERREGLRMTHTQGDRAGDTRVSYVFVHGTAGWGSYDKRNERLPLLGHARRRPDGIPAGQGI